MKLQPLAPGTYRIDRNVVLAGLVWMAVAAAFVFLVNAFVVGG